MPRITTCFSERAAREITRVRGDVPDARPPARPAAWIKEVRQNGAETDTSQE
jgi:hypothetical protein